MLDDSLIWQWILGLASMAANDALLAHRCMPSQIETSNFTKVQISHHCEAAVSFCNFRSNVIREEGYTASVLKIRRQGTIVEIFSTHITSQAIASKQ